MANTAARASTQRPFDYVNIAFLTLTPLIGILGTFWYARTYGVTWVEVALFFLMYLMTGMGITGGYHRYYTHKSYECSKPVQLFYLIFGAAAAQNSALNWCSDHRYHHRFVDQEEDPYNILKGGLHAHMGWIFYKDTRNVHDKYQNIPDLLKDPLAQWQDRWYLFLVVTAGFVLPTAIGALFGRPMAGLLWGGFLRTVVVHHMTFFINSLAHLYGSRPYDTSNTARDSWWLGPLTFGEGYHNFHHKFQADYRNGIRWYQFDMTKWWLGILSFFGQAWRLKKTPEPMILKAKLAVQMSTVERKLAETEHHGLREKIQLGFVEARHRLETAVVQYQHALVEYSHRRHEWSAEMHRQFDERKARYKQELMEARRRWSQMMRAFNRFPHPSAQSLLTLTAVLDVFKHR